MPQGTGHDTGESTPYEGAHFGRLAQPVAVLSRSAGGGPAWADHVEEDRQQPKAMTSPIAGRNTCRTDGSLVQLDLLTTMLLPLCTKRD
jgi:hypothetical protein